MKISDLKLNEYGTVQNYGVVVIRTDKGYICAYNHEVKRCPELPFDMELDGECKPLNDGNHIVQFDGQVKIASDTQLINFIRTAYIHNKDTRHVTITHI